MSKAQQAAETSTTVDVPEDIAALVDTSAIVRSEDVESEECYTF